jgi:hypothetical protein
LLLPKETERLGVAIGAALLVFAGDWAAGAIDGVSAMGVEVAVGCESFGGVCPSDAIANGESGLDDSG